MRILPLVVSLTVACISLAAAPPGKSPQPGAKPPQANPSKWAPSKGDPYSVTVPVDATAASASAAQNNAINGGRSRAWTELSHRLVPQKDWAKLPGLDSGTLERMVRGYTVSSERRSTTRYVARITYVFNPNAVKHLLRVANIGVSEPSGSAILLVAMSPTYNAHSPWAQALAAQKTGAAAFPLVTPIGDEVDQSSLGSARFSEASWGQIQPVAARVHAGEAVLLQATSPAASKVTVRMRRVGPGKPVTISDIEVPVGAGTPPEKVYATAAQQATSAIEDAWKNRGTVEVSKKTTMVAEVRITSLPQWVSLLARLSAIPSVTDVNVAGMNTGEARVNFTYSGTPDQLKSAAGQANLNLADRGGTWWISSGVQAGDEAGAAE
jgi:hypothetical protein